MLYIITTTWIW